MLEKQQGLFRIILVDFTYYKSILLSEKINSEKMLSPAYSNIFLSNNPVRCINFIIFTNTIIT